MAQKRVISFFLSVLLVVYFNHNLPYELCPSHSHKQTFLYFGSQKSAKSLADAGFSFSHQTAKQEHVKVRYRGSECPYHVIPLHIPEAKTYVSVLPRYPIITESIFSGGRISLSLRGPPCPDGQLS